jgi:hypothetical protein
MQPCSQPWYGLIDASNGMSGERLRVMIVRAAGSSTIVRTWRDVSSPISDPARAPSRRRPRRASRRGSGCPG